LSFSLLPEGVEAKSSKVGHPENSIHLLNLMPLDRLSQNTDTDYVGYFIRRKRRIFCDGRHS
jgi:hypothetical protein